MFFKGTVSRDFRVLFFSIEKAAPCPIRGTLGRFQFFAEGSQRYWTKSWLSGVWYTEEWRLGGVWYTVELQLGGVSYTAELVPKIGLLYFVLFEAFFKWIENWGKNLHWLSGVSYTAEYWLGGVSYTAEWWLGSVYYNAELRQGDVKCTG